MGIPCSREYDRETEERRPQRANTEGIVTSSMTGSSAPASRMKARSSKELNFVEYTSKHSQEAPAPSYESGTHLGQILNCYHDCRAKAGYDDLTSWDSLIVIDERPLASTKTKDATLYVAWFIIALLQAYKAPTQLAFMDFMNPEPRSATKEEKELGDFLSKLFVAEEVSDVMGLLGVTDDVPSLFCKRGYLEQIRAIMQDENIFINDRHTRILALIREWKASLMEPWKVKDMHLKDLETLYKSAVQHVSQQPKVVSSLNFSLIRLIEQQIKKEEARSQDTTGTINKQKVFVVTSSTTSKTSYDQLEQALSKVKGGDTEFSITTIQLWEDKIEQSKKLQQKLDDKNVVGKDIYDYVPVDVNRLLEMGPSYMLSGKIFFGHIRCWDRVKDESTFYGKSRCYFNHEGKIALPSVVETRNWLEIDIGLGSGALESNT